MEKKQKKTLKESVDQFRELWNYLLKRWLIICICGFTGGGLGLLTSILKKPKYEGRLSFVLDAESMGALGGLSGIASSFGLGGATGGESVFEGDNLIELLQSKRMIEATLLEKIPGQKQTFAEQFMVFNEWKDGWSSEPELLKVHFPYGQKREKFSFYQDSILNEISTDISDNLLKIKAISNKVTITNVVIETESKVFSRYFPEVLIDVVSDFYIETKTKKAKINYDVLKRQTDSIRIELYNSLAGVASANDNTFGLNPAYNVQRVPSLRKQVDVQANTAILTELVKHLEMARANLLNTTPLIQVIDSPRYPLRETKLRKLHGLIIGGFLGGALILGFLLLSKNLKKEEENKQI